MSEQSTIECNAIQLITDKQYQLRTIIELPFWKKNLTFNWQCQFDIWPSIAEGYTTVKDTGMTGLA